MNTKIMWGIVTVLFIVILVMAWFLFATPAPTTSTIATSTPTGNTNQPPQGTNQPLSSRVAVTSPKANATVGSTIVVSGSAPGNWFFEASFPLQIRDPQGNVLARTFASAQGEWMTTELVTFTSTIHLDSSYRGPATLILMRDNPSGLPENDDAVEIPIVIQ